MKKIMALLGLVTVIMLIATKSLYVEWIELLMILGSLSVLSLTLIVFSKQQTLSILSSSIIIGFVVFYMVGVIDLTVDHFMYFLPTGNEDGMALTLSMKIDEYSDDLFVASGISTLWIISISYLTAWILKLTDRQQKVNS